MNKNIILPHRDILLRNFRNCINWEEKYLYIIELGQNLSPIPKEIESKKHLVPGCQSKVWIIIRTKQNIKQKKRIVEFYGDSDSSITKGLLCIIFIIHQNLTINDLINFNPYPFLDEIELTTFLTYSRSQGIKSILRTIHHQAKKLECIF